MPNLGQGAVNGQLNYSITAVSANYTVIATDEVVQVTPAASAVTVLLPAPTPVGSFDSATMRPDQSTVGQTGNAGQRVRVEKIGAGAGNVVVDGVKPQYIRASGKVTLTSNSSSVTFESDGTFWNVLGTVS